MFKNEKIAGVDEVGRGCLAGPVFAAAKPGKTKRPLPSIPPMLIATTDVRVNPLFNFFKAVS